MVSRRQFMKLASFAAVHVSLGASISAVLSSSACRTPNDLDPDQGPLDPDTGPDANDLVDADALDGAVTVNWQPETIIETPVFDLGISAGSMTETQFLFCSHVAVAPAIQSTQRLYAIVWRSSASVSARESAQEDIAAPSKDIKLVKIIDVTATAQEQSGYCKIACTDAAPATKYQYGFFIADNVPTDFIIPVVSRANQAAIENFLSLLNQRSPLGTVKTAHHPDSQAPVIVAATTCTKYNHMPYIALSRMAEEDCDVFLHLGDMSYNDGAKNVEEYRAHWYGTLNDKGYRDILSKAGMYITWDDHEFNNNFNPEEFSPENLAAGKTAFFETLATEPNQDGGLWKSFRWGKSVEFFILDSRTERRPSTLDTDNQQYISQAQMEFLKKALQQSPCHFKVLMNSVPMTKFDSQIWGFLGDRWQGYEADREEILSFIDENDIKNVWFLSGDFHIGFVGILNRSREKTLLRHRMWEIAVGPGGNLGNPIMALAEASDDSYDEIFPDDQFLYGKGKIAATFLVFDPQNDRVRVRFVDPEDNTTLFDRWLSQRIEEHFTA